MTGSRISLHYPPADDRRENNRENKQEIKDLLILQHLYYLLAARDACASSAFSFKTEG